MTPLSILICYAAAMANYRGARILMVLVLLLLVASIIVFPPSQWLPAAKWGAWLQAQGFAGLAAFMATGVLATSLGFPRQMIAFIAGVAYGTSLGLALSLFAALGGCIVTVLMSRRFLSHWVVGRYPNVIDRLQTLFTDDWFLKVLVLRLQPLGTNFLTNTCVGFTTLPLRQFLLASAVGYVPQMLVFVLLGSGVRVGSQTQLALSGALLVVSIVLGVFLLKKHRIRRLPSAAP